MGKGDYSRAIHLLNVYADYVRSHGASVYFAYPNYPESIFKKNRKAIEYLENQYTKSLKIPIINTPEDFVYPDSLYLDTVYHLSREGRKLRTKRTIEILRSTVFIQAPVIASH